MSEFINTMYMLTLSILLILTVVYEFAMLIKEHEEVKLNIPLLLKLTWFSFLLSLAVYYLVYTAKEITV